MIAIAIPDDVRAAIYAHAHAAFPLECCGYLLGPRDGAVDTQVACKNAQEVGAETGFAIDGAELLAFARSLDTDRPARVVYHSHTNGRAYFSATDREVAAATRYPVQHLVIGVTAAGVTEAAQFAWDGEEIVEVGRWRVQV